MEGLKKYPKKSQVAGIELTDSSKFLVFYAWLLVVCFCIFVNYYNDPEHIVNKLLVCNGLEPPLQHEIGSAALNENNNATISDSIGENAQVAQASVDIERIPLRRVPNPTDKETDYAGFLTHPVQIHHMTWNPASTSVVISGDLVASYLAAVSTTSLGKKIANFYYMRAGIRLRVVVQGSSFAYGQLRMVATPLVLNPYSTNPSGYVTTLNGVNSSVLPHVSIDPSKSDSYELVLDVPTVTGKYSLRPGLGPVGSYRLECHILNPLRTGTTTAPSVAICVYMSFVEPVLEGITLFSNEFVEEKKAGGVLSEAFAGVATLGGYAAAIFPNFAPEITLFSAVSATVGKVLHFFGFAKPPSTDNDSMALNRTHDNFFQFEGRTTGWVLAGTQKNSLGLSPAYAGGAGEDLLISKLVSIPGLLDRDKTIAQASASESLIFSWAVTPMNIISSRTPSPLSGVARVFGYWVGDITYRFEILASVFHRATILIAWDPNAVPTSPPSFAEAVQTLQNTTVNIVGNTTLDVTIPYQQPLNWSKVNGVFTVTGTASTGNATTNGAVFMYVINPVIANGSTDPVVFNLYHYSDNIEFAFPESTRIRTSKRTVAATPIGTEDLMLKTIPEEVGLYSADFKPFSPVDSITFGKSSDLKLSTNGSFGEKYVSLKQLISKATLKYRSSTTVAKTERCVQVTGPVMPNRIGAVAGAGVFNSFLDYFSSAFLGYRGGLRISGTFGVNEDDPALFGTLGAATTISPSANYYFIGPVQTEDLESDTSTNYAGCNVKEALTHRIDVVVPSQMMTYFYPTSTDYPDALHIWKLFGTLEGQTIDSTVFTTVAVGAADDGFLSWFIGFPQEEPI